LRSDHSRSTGSWYWVARACPLIISGRRIRAATLCEPRRRRSLPSPTQGAKWIKRGDHAHRLADAPKPKIFAHDPEPMNNQGGLAPDANTSAVVSVRLAPGHPKVTQSTTYTASIRPQTIADAGQGIGPVRMTRQLYRAASRTRRHSLIVKPATDASGFSDETGIDKLPRA
jgi:hypothetical protein